MRHYLIDVIKAAFDGYEGHAKPTPSPRVADKDLATVYVIGDHHLDGSSQIT